MVRKQFPKWVNVADNIQQHALQELGWRVRRKVQRAKKKKSKFYSRITEAIESQADGNTRQVEKPA